MPKTRKELAAFIAERLASNRESIAETGTYRVHQLKVFWLEVNRSHLPDGRLSPNWSRSDREFYLRHGQSEDDSIWLDAGNPRIWYAFTFGPRHFAEKILRDELFSLEGIDRVWLAEPFMQRVQREHGYQSRGFGIYFRDALSDSPFPQERARFSAKFWVGSSVPLKHQSFLDSAERAFSKSSVRLSHSSASPDSKVSGLLMELYAEGSLTINISEDPEEVLGLVREIGEAYAGELQVMEGSRQRTPRPVELRFAEPIDLDRFQRLVETGTGKTRLWMQQYENDAGLRRYLGVDLHTNEQINFDVAEDYAYIVTEREGCMNAAPRLMTISAQRLSGKTDMFYEGARLFA